MSQLGRSTKLVVGLGNVIAYRIPCEKSHEVSSAILAKGLKWC